MPTKFETFNKPKLKTDLPDIRPGDTVRVYQKIKEGDKEFEYGNKSEGYGVFLYFYLFREYRGEA